MDRTLARLNARRDEDLMICDHMGVAYERQMTNRVAYDADYLRKVSSYRHTDIAKRVNAGRIAFMRENLNAEDLKTGSILDYGCGDCAFIDAAIDAGFRMHGHEVNQIVTRQLRERKILATDLRAYSVICLWDVLEHLTSPDVLLEKLPDSCTLFLSVPIFTDLSKVRESKHYRPGEHHYYFTHDGLITYMRMHGFRFIAMSDHEIEAGREDIAAAVFKKDAPNINSYIMQYHELHLQKHYGSSAVELHFDLAFEWVRRTNAKSILDFGCGRSDLSSYFWNDGKRTIKRYDPAIREYRRLPSETFDLVFVLDVMEHIPLNAVDRVLKQIASRGTTALFAISMKPARQKLPDGTNAHCTLLAENEWLQWIKSHFKRVAKLRSEWDHELLVIASHRAIP